VVSEIRQVIKRETQIIASPGFVGVILNCLKYPYEIINTILSFRFIENGVARLY